MSIEVIKLTDAQARKLVDEEGGEEFEEVETGEWEDEGKWQTSFTVYKKNDTGDFYMLNIYRTGSYYSEYEYEYGDRLIPVEKKEVVVSKWVLRK